LPFFSPVNSPLFILSLEHPWCLDLCRMLCSYWRAQESPRFAILELIPEARAAPLFFFSFFFLICLGFEYSLCPGDFSLSFRLRSGATASYCERIICYVTSFVVSPSPRSLSSPFPLVETCFALIGLSLAQLTEYLFMRI